MTHVPDNPRQSISLKKRVFHYLLLGILSGLTPYVVTMMLIMATGDRAEGMRSGVFPGLLAVHIIFGSIFIKRTPFIRSLLTILLAVIAFGLVWLSLVHEIVRTGWDPYGFWDLAATNFIAGIVVWETFYQVSRLHQNKRKRPSAKDVGHG